MVKKCDYSVSIELCSELMKNQADRWANRVHIFIMVGLIIVVNLTLN